MTRDEFCKNHWEYYLVLERDFMETERYVGFELGDNYVYVGTEATNPENSKVYSVEYIKQYQAICSEVDVILKSICKELGNATADRMDVGYTPTVLQAWSNIKQQKVRMKDIELCPFVNWEKSPNYHSPDWWKPYNSVKHERIDNYKEANLKNVLNALAGLYILENYLVKHIGDRDCTIDVPNEVSKLFEMVDWQTKNHVIGRNAYNIESNDINVLFG